MTTPPQNGVNYRLSRIESDIEGLGRRLDSVSDIVARRAETVAEIKATVEAVQRSTEQCSKAVQELDRKQDEREEKKRVERRSDRRFLVGTLVTATGIVIAALALLINVL